MVPWLCEIRTHEHSTRWEAEACTELSEQLQEALDQLTDMRRNDQDALSALMAMVRSHEVEDAVNHAYAEAALDDVDEEETR